MLQTNIILKKIVHPFTKEQKLRPRFFPIHSNLNYMTLPPKKKRYTH